MKFKLASSIIIKKKRNDKMALVLYYHLELIFMNGNEAFYFSMIFYDQWRSFIHLKLAFVNL